MSREKQIEEMAKDMCDCCKAVFSDIGECKKHICDEARKYAEALYNAGYRKQSEGAWLNGVNNSKVCSMCGKEPLYTKSETAFATTFYRVKSDFCPNCGAKMTRKEDEGK